MTRNCQKLDNILHVMQTASVLCVGDMMLDEYVSGTTTRLSPEAPVPVVHIKDTKQVLGGVGNVAANLADLGCDTSVFYAVGQDSSAERIQELLQQKDICSYPHPISAITTKKQRIIAQNQQICRIDSEQPLTLTQQQEEKIIHQVSSLMPRYNVIILSDYNKGFLSPRVTQGIIQAARQQNKAILVDPKGSNYEKYRGATLIKPNFNELKTAFSDTPSISSLLQNLTFKNSDDIAKVQQAAGILRKKLNISEIVVTLSENGMIGQNDSESIYLPTQAKSVSDVSGAGDTSLAILAASISSNASLKNSIDLANIGSGIVVSKEGTATVSSSELHSKIRELFHAECESIAWHSSTNKPTHC